MPTAFTAQNNTQIKQSTPHQRVNAKVTLRFTPKHGPPLTAHVRLLLG